ncbi:unnamed protein product [Ranitomeya imitator]|uniref:Cyclin N-terminal domain-containing protein n=1 Tax=Ranitomeya imitator TaxID=111125 RepID=A0ABN9KMA7_9NEOB|nr:unnamed protein product [Ranitomeya imitator]
MILGLEGVELGADGKGGCAPYMGDMGNITVPLKLVQSEARPELSVSDHVLTSSTDKVIYHITQYMMYATVSYTQFLYPTNALGARRNTIDSTCSFSQFRNASHRNLTLGRANSIQGSIDTAKLSTIIWKPIFVQELQMQNSSPEFSSDIGDFTEYDPNLLDDPQWPCGKHKRVLIFPSYMTTVLEYVKPSDLKKDMNETFKEKFPHIKLTLSKIRSLKRDIRKLAQDDCGYEEPTVAMAFVYFEKLALKGKLNKQNRKLCAGACILLAAKIGSDLRKHEVKHLIDKLEEKFRLNRREINGIRVSGPGCLGICSSPPRA